MSKSSFIRVLLPLGIIVGAIVIAMGVVSSRKPPEQEPIIDKAFLVEAQSVYVEPVEFVVYSQGNVVPKNQTNVSTQVAGVVTSLADTFVEGGFFNKGDVLLTLEQDDFKTEVKLAEAELAQAQASLQEEIARGKVAEQEWRSVNGTAPPDLGLRKPQLAREKANVQGAIAKLERAKRNLARTQIKAPYNGIVASRSVDLGQFINSGAEIAQIYSTDMAEVRLPLTNSDLAYLDLSSGVDSGNKVELSAQVAGKAHQWEGRLTRSEGVLDENSRVIYAIAQIFDPYFLNSEDEDKEPLRFGQFVQAVISGTKTEDVVVLPRKLLRLDNTVITVTDERELVIKKVELARADTQKVYIKSGLNSADKVVTSPVPNAYTGMKVRLPEDQPEVEEPSRFDKSDDVEQLDTTGGK